MTYQFLIQGNQRFGQHPPNDICLHDLKCEPEKINERVVIAPWWKPDLFTKFGAEIDSASDGEHVQIWNIHMEEFDFTYIRTGIGAPLVADTTLALGGTPCKKAIFIGSVGALDLEYRYRRHRDSRIFSMWRRSLQIPRERSIKR